MSAANGGGERESRSDRAAYLMMRSAEWLGMRIPRSAGLAVSDLYFRLYFERALGQREVVAANLARVLGHPPNSPLVQQATRECFRLYGRYWYETFAMRTMPAEEVMRRFTIDGKEHIDEAVAAGRGHVIALPHMGNWDAAGHWLCLSGYRMTAVAEELKPKAVFELFFRHRRALGMNIVPLSSNGAVGQTLVNLLSQNHVLTLVADRDLTQRGVDVEMFGAMRRLPAGPAYLSLATGTPLSVASVFTTDEGWHCVINPPIRLEGSGVMREDVTATTRVIAAQFERFIAAAPADWHMFQPAWEDALG
jgi:phosphatidylinositol dimannoside acyltransferase